MLWNWTLVPNQPLSLFGIGSHFLDLTSSFSLVYFLIWGERVCQQLRAREKSKAEFFVFITLLRSADGSAGYRIPAREPSSLASSFHRYRQKLDVRLLLAWLVKSSPRPQEFGVFCLFLESSGNLTKMLAFFIVSGTEAS